MIKVRAWNKKTSSWIYWIVGEDCMCDLLVHGFIDKESLGLFTGLLDSEGKELWEGDIAREGGRLGVIKYSKQYARFEIEFPTGRAGLYGFYGKIIGNLTETPELLDDL